MLALPINKMLYIYLLCPHSEHQKNIGSNLNGLNTFTKETSSNKVKLPQVGWNAIVFCPCGGRAQQIKVGMGKMKTQSYELLLFKQ